MATLSFIFLAFSLLCNLLSLPLLTNAISNCGGSCTTSTTVPASSFASAANAMMILMWALTSATAAVAVAAYRCSPAVSSSTQAILTLNDFSEGGDGGDPSQCDERYHSNSESVVALSTGWYNKGSRCGKMIKITASNGRSTTAKVVDECDSVNGCDRAHAGQPPCRNNIVDGSQAVWDALGLNSDVGEAHVTWSMA
ncbi:hypothetical protein K1719_040182 [Acacia pycnantha]|nr:hypothetical protein K1719_040182 [Acacia pycnantha]